MLRRWIADYCVSVHFQLGLQLAVATVLSSLPTFVRALHFPRACFVPVLTLISLVSMSPSPHMGTKLLAAVNLLGETWLGALLAGVTVSLARSAHDPTAQLALLAVLGSAGIALLASARAGPRSLTLWPHLTMSLMNYAVGVLFAQHTPGLALVWRQDIGGLLLAGCWSCLVSVLVSVLVLPRLAGEEALQLTSVAIRGTGHSLTRYLSLLLDTTPLQAVAASDAAGNLKQQRTGPGSSRSDGCQRPDTAPAGDQLAAGSPASADAAVAGTAAAGAGTVQQQQQQQQRMCSSDGGGGWAGSSTSDEDESCLQPSASTNAAATAVTAAAAALPWQTGGAGSSQLPLQSLPSLLFDEEHGWPEPWRPSHSSAAAMPHRQRRQHGRDSSSTLGRLPQQHIQSATADAARGAVEQHHHHHQQHRRHPLLHHRRHQQPLPATQQQQQQQQQQGRSSAASGRLTPLLPLVKGRHSASPQPPVPLLEVPGGPSIALLGPATDDLRLLLRSARSCLAAVAFEPRALTLSLSLGRGSSCCSPAAAAMASADAPAWQAVVAAAEALVTRVSGLEGVLVAASPRLISPLLQRTTLGLANQASVIIFRAITLCAELSAAVGQQPGAMAGAGSSSWQQAMTDLTAATAEAVQCYWEAVATRQLSASAHHQQQQPTDQQGQHQPLRVASSKEAEAVVFVWLLVGGLLEAAESLEAAVVAAVAPPPAAACSKQCELAQLLMPVARAVLMTPVLHNIACNLGSAAGAAAGAATAAAGFCRRTALALTGSSSGSATSAAAQDAELTVKRSRVPAAAAAAASPSWRSRSVAAAFKIWAAMSVFLALVLVISANPVRSISAEAASAVAFVPTHGVIALVLAWHERVESTLIRVVLRTLGTAAGAGISATLLTSPFLASCPPLLVLLLAIEAALLAPLVSASLHLRFAVALTLIGSQVVVLCQAVGSGAVDGQARFVVARMIEVAVACSWAGLFNRLVLPWRTADQCRDTIGSSFAAAVQLLQQTCAVQHAAYALQPQHTEPACVVLLDGGPPGGAKAAAPLSQQQEQQRRQLSAIEQQLEQSVVSPLTGVQQSLVGEVHLWREHAPRHLVPRSVRRLLTEMLNVADTLTALLVTVAALPAAPAGSPLAALDAALPTAAADRHHSSSRRYLVEQLMRPLHASQASLLTGLAEVAAAVQACLATVPGGTPASPVCSLMLQRVQQQWADSQHLFAAARRQLHSDIRPRQQGESCMGWWLTAAEHYMQQVAFEHAFDCAVGQLLVVARIAHQ